MSNIRQECLARGYDLPAPSPRGSYRSAVRHGDLLYVSGQVSRVGDSVIVGPVDDLPDSRREEAARVAALRALAILADELAPGERVRILKLTVFVMSTAGFEHHTQVADGASRLLNDVLGEGGVHSRTAVGVPSLPSRGAVELDLICSVSAAGA